MSAKTSKIAAVPVNIITGFLGVGKTTAILHLLKHKPAGERWAVLVNEFGEIGVDGSLLQAQHGEAEQVFIREVPGGCMCCAAGLPMQVALNQLLAKAKPQRLLIEPTGLGHPLEVLETLNSEHYQGVLDIQYTLTLVDARKLQDARYRSHATFNQQIDIADLVIGNKADLYGEAAQADLRSYVSGRVGERVPVIFAQQGEFDPALLAGRSRMIALKSSSHHHHSSAANDLNTQALPECGYVQVRNAGEGFESVGWRFAADKVFAHDALFQRLSAIKAERLKAVFITDCGVFAYNLTADGLSETALVHAEESKLEIIYRAGEAVEDFEPLA